MNKTHLRRHFRHLRRSLSAAQQFLAAQKLWKNICAQPEFKRAKNIALYFACDGEISPHLIAATARRKNKQTFYPVLHAQHMLFRNHCERDALRRNHFGIPEPHPRQRTLSPRQLDLVILPLVSFDRDGHRLGMGGGFYDRAFAFKQRRPGRKPLLIGVAHELQRCEQLAVDAWDIPLDRIITDNAVYRIQSSNNAHKPTKKAEQEKDRENR